MPAEKQRELPAQRAYATGLTVDRSPIDGLGCFATDSFPMGRRVAVYEGERITSAEGAQRMRRQRKKRISAINSRWSIDGSVGGNGTEYINHSCHPTCISLVIGEQIAIYAVCDISPGDEVTVDYFDAMDFSSRICSCGASCCRGR